VVKKVVYKTTSSDAMRPTLPKMAFAEREKAFLWADKEHLKESYHNVYSLDTKISEFTDPRDRYTRQSTDIRTRYIHTRCNTKATRFVKLYSTLFTKQMV